MDVVNTISGAREGVSAGSSETQAELRKAVADFEALFINQMLKTMRETVDKGDLFNGGSGEEIYTSLLDAELSRVMARAGGIGLGDILLRDFTGAEPLPLDKGLPLRAYAPAHAPEVRMPSAPEAPARGMEFMFPVKGEAKVSSGFGMRTDPLTREERFHHGIDIAAAEGTPVFPAAPGRVVFSGWKGGYGNLVEVLHDDGHVTRYGHNAENLVKAGDRVDTSRPIAYVGSTGRSTGPHLHFEVLMNGIALNPDTFYG